MSRALKVHNNVAKQYAEPLFFSANCAADCHHRMLYDFHREHSKKKSGGVHATYFLSGVKRKAQDAATNGYHTSNGEDTTMQDSFVSSSMPQEDSEEASIPTKTIMLVGEENLEGIVVLRTA